MSDFIDTIFKNEPYPPYSFDIHIDAGTIEEMFDQFIQMFIRGCSILYGDGQSFSAFDMTEERIQTMKHYFKSMGIDLLFYSYSLPESDDIYKDFIHEFKMLVKESSFSEDDYHYILFRDRNGLIRNTKWFFKEKKVRDLFREATKTQIHYQNIFSSYYYQDV